MCASNIRRLSLSSYLQLNKSSSFAGGLAVNNVGFIFKHLNFRSRYFHSYSPRQLTDLSFGTKWLTFRPIENIRLKHQCTIKSNYSTSVCESCSHRYQLTEDNSTAQHGFVQIVSCPKCNALQTMTDGMLPNYFEILAHQVKYRIDPVKISYQAKQLQKIFHPDLFTAKSESQKELSQQYSSLINEAVSTLMDPVARGKYIISLSGFLKNVDAETSMTNDPEFLETVMELNEQLETIETRESWEDFETENKKTMMKIDRELEQAFEAENYEQAQLLLERMKYFTSLQAKVKELQSRMGIIQ